jgi:hypothetical protein
MPQRVQRQCVLTAQVGPTSRPLPCATTACRLLRVPSPLAPSRSRRCGGVHRCKHSKKNPKEKNSFDGTTHLHGRFLDDDAAQDTVFLLHTPFFFVNAKYERQVAEKEEML